MKTCFVVNDKDDLFKKINNYNRITNAPGTPEDKLQLTPWINKKDDLVITAYCFDNRIGWNTHIVMIKSQCTTRDPYIIGFLSDNLE